MRGKRHPVPMRVAQCRWRIKEAKGDKENDNDNEIKVEAEVQVEEACRKSFNCSRS